MINVEWESSVIQHGRNRGKLRSSTVHGWLTKMRGTIIGDEKMRWKGIQEMKSASYHREKNSKSPTRRRSSSGGGVFSALFGSTSKKTNGSRGRGSRSTRSGARPGPRRAHTMPSKRADSRPHSGRRPSASSGRRSSTQSTRSRQPRRRATAPR